MLRVATDRLNASIASSLCSTPSRAPHPERSKDLTASRIRPTTEFASRGTSPGTGSLEAASSVVRFAISTPASAMRSVSLLINDREHGPHCCGSRRALSCVVTVSSGDRLLLDVHVHRVHRIVPAAQRQSARPASRAKSRPRTRPQRAAARDAPASRAAPEPLQPNLKALQVLRHETCFRSPATIAVSSEFRTARDIRSTTPGSDHATPSDVTRRASDSFLTIGPQ